MATMSGSASHLHAFADYVTVIYHEARNVRHLRRSQCDGLECYERLINLPRNRYEAWRALHPLRVQASMASSARTIEAVFRKQFGPGLEDLQTLFENPNWRHSARGGNRWAHITHVLICLRDAIDSRSMRTVSQLQAAIPQMRHNTGTVRSKLRDLDGCLPRMRS